MSGCSLRVCDPRNDEDGVRSVAEYLEKAAEFEALAAKATVDVLRKRYGDIAACYRLLAKEWEWLIGTGAIEGQPRIRRHRTVRFSDTPTSD
jgi:hypothetical protein